MIKYTLTRSRRKTISIYVKPASVEVRAPLKAAVRDIDSFVSSKEKWINEKLLELSRRQSMQADFSLSYGSRVLYLGTEHPIVFREGSRAGFDGECFYMPPGLSPEQIKRACIFIYRALAKHELQSRVRHFAELMNLVPIAVKINGAKTRWGSCSAKKRINFSWQLMMAERDVIDYVVVHELTHLLEMNHSARFWAALSGVLPDYKERQKRLKLLQKKLSEEDWK